jgi:hypothetical protein
MRTINESTIWLDRAELAVIRVDPSVLRETMLERAVQTGKIPATRRDAYRQQYKRDPLGTVRLLASLSPGPKPSDAKILHEFERRQDHELLASARAAFPELRRRHDGGATLPLRPAAPRTRRAGWYRRTNGAPVVKDAGRSRAPLWQNYVPPERGDPPQHFVTDLESGPAPFPAGLNVRD